MKEMPKGYWEACRQAWLDVPSQDNEGYVPDRGGFKCGWYSAIQWMLSQGYSRDDKTVALVEALKLAKIRLQRIENPRKYHHDEPDDYTRLACAQFQAQEGLKEVEDALKIMGEQE